MNKKITIHTIKKFKSNKKPFSCITAYDSSMATIIDSLEIPIILVGDSASMVMMGNDSTVPITLEEMLVFVKSVSNNTKNSLVVADMPFMSYQESNAQAIKNAGLFIKNGGANAVKIEGGCSVSGQINALVNYGIPVMGHIGLLPQSINQQSGYNIQGKNDADANKLIKDALAVQNSGAFSIVLEGIPSSLAKTITQSLEIPTIGIGAGPYCDGQIQVFHDIMGLFNSFVPRHTKQYINLTNHIKSSLNKYIDDVKNKKFPSKEHYQK
tara:strand:+ start:183 stop:986 length:804 start_codon:yes stop_codon:yes gene_type:complete